ncbi:MAG: hypothetical protein ABFD45_11525 [Smithella sp.]|jgi:hypothetical protein
MKDVVARIISIKRLACIFSALPLLFLLFACAGPQQHILRTEKDYQHAFNDVYFRGKAQMEVHVKYGRVDLLSDDYAIEVDNPDNFHEAIGQALHYAKETGKKPAVAFYIADQKHGDREKLKYAIWLCDYYKIKTWFINDELKKARKK